MSFDSSKVFTKQNLDLVFRDLSKEYKRLGGRKIPVDIVLIGGAAIIEGYGFREMTTDIDALLPDMSIMQEAINHVGDLHGFPNGWMNADFMKTASYSHKLYQYSVPYKTFNQVLNVRMVTGEYLVAMKLRSGRQYKNDLSDIIGILAEHKKAGSPLSYQQIEEAVVKLYGSWEGFPEESIHFIKQALALDDPTVAYKTIRDNEVRNGIGLEFFQEQYPGVLSEKNISSVITNFAEKKDGRQSLIKQLQELRAQAEHQPKESSTVIHKAEQQER